MFGIRSRLRRGVVAALAALALCGPIGPAAAQQGFPDLESIRAYLDDIHDRSALAYLLNLQHDLSAWERITRDMAETARQQAERARRALNEERDRDRQRQKAAIIAATAPGAGGSIQIRQLAGQLFQRVATPGDALTRWQVKLQSLQFLKDIAPREQIEIIEVLLAELKLQLRQLQGLEDEKLRALGLEELIGEKQKELARLRALIEGMNDSRTEVILVQGGSRLVLMPSKTLIDVNGQQGDTTVPKELTDEEKADLEALIPVPP